MDQKKTGRFLRELRKESGLTQEQLSEKMGVTNRTVSRWENGVNMPDFDLVIELANLYEVSIEELLDGERRTEMIDQKKEEELLKFADYESSQKMVFSKRMGYLFTAALIAYLVYLILDQMGLSRTGIYEDIASLAMGFVLGVLIMGVVLSSRYGARIRAFKMRILKWGR